MILIDSPPVSPPPDATVLATMAEGTVLVSVGLTKREVLQRAKDRLLAQQGVNLLGLTVNRAKLYGSYYDYSSDRGDGESKRSEEGG